MVEGANQYIGAENMYNGGVEDLNKLHLYMMSQMEKPTTKAELIDETYDCTELFNVLCDVLTRLGYIQPVNL